MARYTSIEGLRVDPAPVLEAIELQSRRRRVSFGEIDFIMFPPGSAFYRAYVERWLHENLSLQKMPLASVLITQAGAIVPPHIDELSRKAAINIPVAGEWDKSLLTFHDPQGARVDGYRFGEAVMFDTSDWHGVDNAGSSTPRVVFSLCFKSRDYAQLRALHENGELLRSR